MDYVGSRHGGQGSCNLDSIRQYAGRPYHDGNHRDETDSGANLTQRILETGQADSRSGIPIGNTART